MSKQEVNLFKKLHDSYGDELIAYLEEVITYTCDARKWREGDTKESAVHASRVIQEKIINKIKAQNIEKNVDPNQFQ